jgi:hypothetical protein
MVPYHAVGVQFSNLLPDIYFCKVKLYYELLEKSLLTLGSPSIKVKTT